MKKRAFTALALAAALMTAGCAGQTAGNTQNEAAQAADTTAAADAGAAASTADASGEQKNTTGEYESPDGWKVSYDNSLFEMTEGDGVTFTYKGEAAGDNKVSARYYAEQMPDEALYNAMADGGELPEHTRSEGYFGSGTDVWCLMTETAGEAGGTAKYTAVEHNGGTLVLTQLQSDEKAASAMEDLEKAVEIVDHQPQTYCDYVPGKYVTTYTEEIEGNEVSAEFYVQLNEDHTGVLQLQDDVPVIWYCREGRILHADTNEQIYEYTVEGDALYLSDVNDEMETIEFEREGAEIADVPDYAKEENWAYFAIGEDKDADLFLICPTVDTLDEENMSLENDVMKGYFIGALNMERGIYEDSTRMYAPYYRQMAMNGYELEDEEEKERRLALAYEDVSAAFDYYLEHENDGRPIILAGFSQGADMCYRLMEEYFGDEELKSRLVAVYAIGWACTEEMVREYPQIVPAQSADDLGVVISFDCESPETTETLVNPAGQKAYCINPLNWKTDATPADKSENKGACFTGYKGEIKDEIPELCGCYIDEERGALKVTEVTPEEYPAKISIFQDGAYHIYDYQFFFRNLEENVQNRVELYMEQAAAAAA